MTHDVSTIDPSAPGTTLINVFHTTPETQRKVLATLQEATQGFVRHQPGFLSANLHASLDGRKVVNYSQWLSQEDFQRMLSHPLAQDHFHTLQSLARSEGGLYGVAFVCSAQGSGAELPSGRAAQRAYEPARSRRPSGELGVEREV